MDYSLLFSDEDILSSKIKDSFKGTIVDSMVNTKHLGEYYDLYLEYIYLIDELTWKTLSKEQLLYIKTKIIPNKIHELELFLSKIVKGYDIQNIFSKNHDLDKEARAAIRTLIYYSCAIDSNSTKEKERILYKKE